MSRIVSEYCMSIISSRESKQFYECNNYTHDLQKVILVKNGWQILPLKYISIRRDHTC